MGAANSFHYVIDDLHQQSNQIRSFMTHPSLFGLSVIINMGHYIRGRDFNLVFLILRTNYWVPLSANSRSKRFLHSTDTNFLFGFDLQRASLSINDTRPMAYYGNNNCANPTELLLYNSTFSISEYFLIDL